MHFLASLDYCWAKVPGGCHRSFTVDDAWMTPNPRPTRRLRSPLREPSSSRSEKRRSSPWICVGRQICSDRDSPGIRWHPLPGFIRHQLSDRNRAVTAGNHQPLSRHTLTASSGWDLEGRGQRLESMATADEMPTTSRLGCRQGPDCRYSRAGELGLFQVYSLRSLGQR